MKLNIPYKVGQKLWVVGVTDEVAEKCECCNHTKEWKNVYSIKEDTIEQIDIHIQENTTTMNISFEDDESMFRIKSIYLSLNLETNNWDFNSCYITFSKEDAETKLKELNRNTQGKETRSELMKKMLSGE